MSDIIVSEAKKVNILDKIIQNVVIMVNISKMNRAIDEHLTVIKNTERDDQRTYQENILREMIKLNKDKIQIRYITGIGKTQLNYPTALDILYESCVENADETLFSHAKMENRYGVSDEKISEVINELLDKKYIEQSGSKFKIIGTPWD